MTLLIFISASIPTYIHTHESISINNVKKSCSLYFFLSIRFLQLQNKEIYK